MPISRIQLSTLRDAFCIVIYSVCSIFLFLFAKVRKKINNIHMSCQFYEGIMPLSANFMRESIHSIIELNGHKSQVTFNGFYLVPFWKVEK